MKPADKEIIIEAKRVLYSNLKVGYSRWASTDYKYVCPSRYNYPHQWFWDSCFHAIVLSHFDIELAKNEITNLLKIQREDGFIPHMIFWQRGPFGLKGLLRPLESLPSLSPKTSQLIQPPLLAQAVEAIYKKDQDNKFLHEVLPKTAAYYKWLARERDPDSEGLISIIAPYESGMDQSPSYDPVLGVKDGSAITAALAGRAVTFRNMIRSYNLKKMFEADYFNVKDVLVNSIYIKNLQILSRLLNEIDEEEEARHFHYLAAKAKETLIKKCYDRKDKIFYDLYGKEKNVAKVKTIKGLFPLILDIPKSIARDLVKKHLLNEDEFAFPFGIPTVAKNEISFSPAPVLIAKEPIIWRGPTWINTNWYLIKALRHHGFKKEADKITEKSVDLVKNGGFREFYNPYTGEGYGARDFGWSTLVVDLILS